MRTARSPKEGGLVSPNGRKWVHVSPEDQTACDELLKDLIQARSLPEQDRERIKEEFLKQGGSRLVSVVAEDLYESATHWAVDILCAMAEADPVRLRIVLEILDRASKCNHRDLAFACDRMKPNQ